MKLKRYVEQIRYITNKAKSESKLEGEVNQIFKECLKDFGVIFDPAVNQNLSSLGLSQQNSNRPDGVFGHIVYDYKAPKSFQNNLKTEVAKKKIITYLNSITGGHKKFPEECKKWIGFLFDGETFFFCRSNNSQWYWMVPMPLSESSLLYLVHIFRSLQRKPLTPQFLSTVFGKQTDVSIKIIRIMCDLLATPKHKTNMLLREWKRLFEQVSTYNLEQLPSLGKWARENEIFTQDASHILFSLHTYYSIIVKILTTELLSISSHNPKSICEEIVAATDDNEVFLALEKLENSDTYRNYRISNFLEGDFFSWYVDEREHKIAEGIRNVAQEFLQFEPASAIFLAEQKQDILKEFYSSLVDEQIRHDLGEYYTPDWLAQYLYNAIDYNGEIETSLLDPSCGSGTFLVEAINRLKQTCLNSGISRKDTLVKILDNVKGMDLNPLAVISARANYILSIFEYVIEIGDDIEIPIYLADSINVPIEKTDALGAKYLEYNLDTEIEKFVLEFPIEFISTNEIGYILLECEDAIKTDLSFNQFIDKIRQKKEVNELLSETVTQRLGRFYEIIKSLETQNWDRIWCRIIKNNFSPRGFKKFNLIIGNPPWVRWSRLPISYRNRVKSFCQHYGLISGQSYSGGIESDISTVITFSAADNWLKIGGKVAFLITNTVFKSSSARGFRIGALPDNTGLKIVRIEDLSNLQPFQDANNATGVYIAERVSNSQDAIVHSINYKIWKPKAGINKIHPSTSIHRINKLCEIFDGKAIPIADWGSPFFTGEINDFDESVYLQGHSEYINQSRRGVTTDAARIYWVKVLRFSNDKKRALIRTLNLEELTKAQKVEPTNDYWIESELLYPLIRGRDLGRYCFRTEGYYQIIPNTHYSNMISEGQFNQQYPLAYKYFKKYEKELKQRSTYKRYQKRFPFYAIYCVGDYSFKPFKVAWMEQQDPHFFRASVISNTSIYGNEKKVFVPDHKLYFAAFDSENEAYYLCGYLNSKPVRTWLGGFLLGKQIGTTIFEYMKVPLYNSHDNRFLEIVEIARNAHERRQNACSSNLLVNEIEHRLANLVKSICTS